MKGLSSRLLRAGVAVGAALVVFKLAGLVQSIVVGHYLPKAAGDVYVFAFENCIFALFLLGDGIIGPALMPIFMRDAASGPEGERRAWRNASAFLTWQFIILAAMAALLAAFPEFFVRLLTSWTPTTHPDKFALAASTVRRLSPALLGLSLGSTTYTLLNAQKRFFVAALGDAAWKCTAIAALLVFARGSADPAGVLVAGLVAGSVAKFVLHLSGLGSNVRRLRPTLRFERGFPRAFAALAWPLLFGAAFALLRDNLNNVYFPSLLTDGIMQANSWGSKLEKVLVVLIPTTLSIAAFPFLCEMAADKGSLASFVSKTARQLVALFLPLAAFVAAAAVPMTSLLFQGGAFDAVSVRRTALSMALYTFALPAVAVETILMKAFFASRRTLAVSLLGIAFSSLSVVMTWAGSRAFAGREMAVLAVIAGGFAISRWLKTATLSALFFHGAKRTDEAQATSCGDGVASRCGPIRTAFFIFRVSIASAAVAAATHFAVAVAAPRTAAMAPKVGALCSLAAAAVTAFAALAATFAALRITEPVDLARSVIRNRRRTGD